MRSLLLLGLAACAVEESTIDDEVSTPMHWKTVDSFDHDRLGAK